MTPLEEQRQARIDAVRRGPVLVRKGRHPLATFWYVVAKTGHELGRVWLSEDSNVSKRYLARSSDMAELGAHSNRGLAVDAIVDHWRKEAAGNL